MFIIIWRNSLKEPHIHTDSHGFKEMYSTYKSAKEDAENIMEQEGGVGDKNNIHFFDYAIYEEAEG